MAVQKNAQLDDEVVAHNLRIFVRTTMNCSQSTVI